jgi:hypothetical protein
VSFPVKLLKKLIEPEIIDDREQSVAYAKADFSTSNQWFVDSLLKDGAALSSLAALVTVLPSVMLASAATTAREQSHVPFGSWHFWLVSGASMP